MAVDIEKLFNEDLPARMARHGDAARQIGAKFQINITGDDHDEWYVDASDSGPRIERGNPGGADCTITLAAEDFQKFIESPNAGMQLFFMGKLKISGNSMLAQKLSKLFTLGS